MANGCWAQPWDVGGMRELLHRLASGEVVRLSDPEIEQLLPSVGQLTENIPHAAEPAAELRAWSRLLVALTDRLADGPLDPASPRDRVLRIMVGKAAGMASAALHQVVSLRGGHPVSDLFDGDLRAILQRTDCQPSSPRSGGQGLRHSAAQLHHASAWLQGRSG